MKFSFNWNGLAGQFWQMESAQDTITFISMQNTKTNVSQVKKETSYGKRKNSTYILAMLPFAISYKKKYKIKCLLHKHND